MMSSLDTVARATGGTLLGADSEFDGVCTDTRSIGQGELFVALQGPNFDGTDYVGEAVRRGAAGAVVARQTDDPISQVSVADTRIALGQLAAAWRRKQSAVVVGITGSNGKTTLKEMTASCLAAVAPTLATQGNLNNDIGMPLMMTRIDNTHRYVVLEMGANHAGEIEYLCQLADPDVVAITNAGAAHLEGFGSIEGVAKAKGEILRNPIRPGVAVLNADDDYFDYWSGLVSDIDMLSFGFSDRADVSATDIVADSGGSSFKLRLPDDSVDIRLSLPGEHNVRNACAAAAIATALGVDAERICAGLEQVRPVAGRLQPLTGLHGATLFDDSYNANPLSVVAAARFLSELPGRSFLVLGDMGELGAEGAALHGQAGAAAREAGIDRLFATGDLSRNTVGEFGRQGRWFDSVEALIADLSGQLADDVNVLVKGSRFMRMERVVAALTAANGGDD